MPCGGRHVTFMSNPRTSPRDLNWFHMAHDFSESAQDSVALVPRRRGPEPVAPQTELYAALDLGTNSCRMLIATPEVGRFRVVDAFAKSVRLGSGLERTGHLSRGAIGRTLAALEVCAEKLERYHVKNVRLVATEACRRARNGNHFLALARPRDRARARGDPARGGGAAGGDLLRAAGLAGGRAGAGLRHRRRVDRAGLARSRGDRAGAAGAGDREPADEREPRGPEAARIVDFISVPLGVATLHERYADVAEDSARFALMSWFFEEQIAGLQALRRDAAQRRSRGVPDDRHLGHGHHGRRGAPRAEALRPAQGGRDAAVGAGDRGGDRAVPAARAGGAAQRHRARARPLGADHVRGGDPADAAPDLADRSRCASPTAACARGCSSR